MARHTLLFYFLLFLPLLASAIEGFNATVANCIDFDMANVEELISTLRTVENSKIEAFNGADEDKKKNQPFGNLKTDWTRLQLLQEALPSNSLLKDKFKHIFRLLFIAHDQATRISNLSKSTRNRDAVEKQTPILSTNNNHTDAEEVEKNLRAENENLSSKSEEIKAKMKNLSTSTASVIDSNTESSFHGLSPIYDKSTANVGDAVEIQKITTVSAELGEAKKNNVATNSVDLDPPINSSTTTAGPISILEDIKSSTSDCISNADTIISEEGITFPTPTHEESKQSTGISLSESTSADEEVISMGQTTKMILGMETSSSFEEYTTSTTESLLKKNYSFKPNPKNASTKIQLSNSSSSENDFLSTTEEPEDKSSLQPAIKMDPEVKSSITEKYSSPATISSIVPTKSQPFVSESNDKLQTSSLQKNENIPWTQSTSHTLLAENFTAGLVKENESILGETQTQRTLKTESYSSNTQLNSEIRDFDTSHVTKGFTTENTSFGGSEVEENKDIHLGISNQTKNSSSTHLTSNTWTNMPPTFEDIEIKLTTQKKQNGDSITEKSIPKILSTIDWMENMSRVTPTIEKNEDNKLASQNNQSELSITEKSIANLSTTKNPVEKVSDVPITFENDGKSETTSSNNKTENSTDNVERISNITPKIENNEDNKLASQNNQTEPSMNEKSIANLSTTKNPMEKILDVAITSKNDGKGEITSFNNKTENSTDYVERILNITPKIENNEDNKLASQNNRIESSITEKSSANVSTTKNSIEKISDVPIAFENDGKSETTSSNNKTENSTDNVEWISNSTPTNKNNEDNKLASKNNQTEPSITEKSIANLSTTENPIGKGSDVPINLENDENGETTSSNNNMENSTDYVERISNITSKIENNKDNKLASRNNQTEPLINENSTANISKTKSSTEITSVAPIQTEHDGKDEITSLQNETKKSMHVNMTSNNFHTTDSVRSTSSVTPNVDKNEDNKLESTNNQTKTLISDNSSTSKNNHKENSVSEKSTSNEWSNKDSTENVQSTTPMLTMLKETKSPTQNNEPKVPKSDKSISNNNEVSSTSTSTSPLNNSNLPPNTVQFVAGTKIPDASNTQHFVSTKPSITEQEAETSTRNYVSEKSKITTNNIEINIPTDSSTLINETELSEAFSPTENATNNQSNLENISKKTKDITTVPENSEPRSDSENRRANSKPSFVKNPLNTGSSRSNKIFQDFKHGSGDNEAGKNAESPQIVLYETGAGAKTGSVWRPHLVRPQPAGNNIWRFDNFPNNVGPHGYGYKPAASPIDSKIDIRKDEKNPAKFPSPGSRMNLLRSRKRGSANSDVEKQFRWFYRHGRKDTALESREKENVNSKIKIRCKKTQR